MSIGDSIIRVTILGDAKKLVGALGEADKATGGLLGNTVKGIGGALIALGAVREGFGFLEDSTKEADRLNDAMTRLTIQLGGPLEAALASTAGNFHILGASSQDILELEANFADLATKAGLSDAAIAGNAEQVAKVAFATSQLENVDPAAVVEAMGKAAGGSSKAYAFLGVNVNETEVAIRAMTDTGKNNAGALTDQEKAAARLEIILDQLSPKVDAVTAGTGDLERQQKKLDAATEELQAKLGGPLSDALATVLGFINDEVDAIPGAIEGFKLLGHAVEGFGRTALGPLGNVRDVLEEIQNLALDVAFNLTHLGTGTSRAGNTSSGSEANTRAAQDNYRLRNGQGAP